MYPFSNPIGAYQNTILAAFAKWKSVANIPLVQVADGANNTVASSIRIGFGALNTGNTGTIGITSYHYSNPPTGQVFAPDTLVRLEDPAELTVNSSGGYNGTSALLYQVALHEIGHALGLAHSVDPNSVMYATVSGSNQDLNAGDIAGMQALYGPTPLAVATTGTPATTGTAAGTTTPSATIDLNGVAGQQLVDLTSSLLAPAPAALALLQPATAPAVIMIDTDETKTPLIAVHVA